MLTFFACLALAFWLWQRQGRQPNGVGEVEAIRVDVSAQVDGVLVPLLSRGPWQVLDAVEAGAEIASQDERPQEAKLTTFRAELARLRKTLEAEQARVVLAEAERRAVHVREAARLAWDAEQARLATLDRRASIEADRVILERREARVKSLTPLHDRKAISDVEFSDECLLRDEVKKRLAETEKALEGAKSQYDGASKRLKELPPLVLAEAKQLLAPVEAAVGVQEAAVQQLETERERLKVRSPMAGIIVAVHRRPGQSVRAGDPIVTIAAERGQYVVGYVPQENRFRPEVGMAVEVRARLPGSPTRDGVVDRVGPQVELIPQHQRRNPQVMEWGQPVRIVLPEGLESCPGELVDIRFQPASRADAG